VTARAAEAAGLHVDVVADESTVGSLVAALARRLEA
jgi:uroporphyrinogen-III synthase